jgi:hypothetical protein
VVVLAAKAVCDCSTGACGMEKQADQQQDEGVWQPKQQRKARAVAHASGRTTVKAARTACTCAHHVGRLGRVVQYPMSLWLPHGRLGCAGYCKCIRQLAGVLLASAADSLVC